jgi:tetratricopeptide (TPR) repeat protein
MPLALALLMAAADPASLRAQATAAYRAKSYVVACHLFAQVVELSPADGAAWSDLGLCLRKLGKRDQAIEANRKAAGFGDARTRLNAYHNLAALGATLPVPDSTVDAIDPTRWHASCAVLAAPAGCAHELFACSRFEDRSGTGSRFVRGSLVFGTDPATLEVYLSESPGAAAPQGSEAIETSSYAANYCRPLDVCGPDLCTGEKGESQRRCQEAAYVACRKAMARCNSEPVVRNARCAVVFADACGGHLGLVCAGKPRELALPPAR